jgi:2-oxo-4-hydroxy-4-carboxy--5-ureidoimidazoline (OHCU) decarboxylase
MASQMLASVKGMSACTTPNEASASTTEALRGVTAGPDIAAKIAELVDV